MRIVRSFFEIALFPDFILYRVFKVIPGKIYVHIYVYFKVAWNVPKNNAICSYIKVVTYIIVLQLKILLKQ